MDVKDFKIVVCGRISSDNKKGGRDQDIESDQTTWVRGLAIKAGLQIAIKLV